MLTVHYMCYSLAHGLHLFTCLMADNNWQHMLLITAPAIYKCCELFIVSAASLIWSIIIFMCLVKVGSEHKDISLVIFCCIVLYFSCCQQIHEKTKTNKELIPVPSIMCIRDLHIMIYHIPLYHRVLYNVLKKLYNNIY